MTNRGNREATKIGARVCESDFRSSKLDWSPKREGIDKIDQSPSLNDENDDCMVMDHVFSGFVITTRTWERDTRVILYAKHIFKQAL